MARPVSGAGSSESGPLKRENESNANVKLSATASEETRRHCIVWGVGFKVCGWIFGVWGSRFVVGSLRFGVRGLGFGVWRFGFNFWGLSFRVEG